MQLPARPLGSPACLARPVAPPSDWAGLLPLLDLLGRSLLGGLRLAVWVPWVALQACLGAPDGFQVVCPVLLRVSPVCGGHSVLVVEDCSFSGLLGRDRPAGLQADRSRFPVLLSLYFYFVRMVHDPKIAMGRRSATTSMKCEIFQ